MNKNKTPVERPVVYDGGFGFKVDLGKYPDLAGHLFTEFLKDRDEQKRPPIKKRERDALLAFLEFARDYLDKNPPQSQTYVGHGIAVKLQNGVTVTFSTKDATVVEHRDDSIALNRPKSQPGQHGISDMGSVPITTGQTSNKVPDARTQVDPPDQEPAPKGRAHAAAPRRGKR